MVRQRDATVSGLRTNLAANIAGTGSLALVQLACVPFYIRFLGIAAYGLVGFFMTLQATLRIFDFGLSPTMNREMARYSVQAGRPDEMRDFVRTVEIGYWALGATVGAVVCAAAPLLVTHWINVSSMPPHVAQQAVMIMGGVIAVHWPLSLYQSALTGLQRQVDLNAVRIAAAVLSGGGALLILWLVSPTIIAFFAWQMAVCLVEVLLLAACLWSRLPPATRPVRVNPVLVKPVLGFAGGMGGIALAGMILTQMDKLILSGLLPLEMFGYYTLAGMAANSLHLFIGPVFAVTFPRLCALVASADHEMLGKVYHDGTQLMSVLVFPLALTIGFFASDVLRLWTGNALLAQQAAPILVFLIAGTAINGAMFLPYALQIAHGWTKLALAVSVGMCLAMVPAVYFMGTHYGAAGAAAVWTALNVLNLLIAFPLTHRRLRHNDAWEWIGKDVALPLMAAAAVTLSARCLLVLPSTKSAAVTVLALILAATMVVAAASASRVRHWVVDLYSGIPARRGHGQA